jgi:hypothetical protein
LGRNETVRDVDGAADLDAVLGPDRVIETKRGEDGTTPGSCRPDHGNRV